MGGLLRDERGKILCLFFFFIEVRDLNEVEFLVFIFVLECSVFEVRVKGREIIIELDFLNVIVWVINK